MNVNLAEKIKSLRKERGISQEKLAPDFLYTFRFEISRKLVPIIALIHGVTYVFA